MHWNLQGKKGECILSNENSTCKGRDVLGNPSKFGASKTKPEKEGHRQGPGVSHGGSHSGVWTQSQGYKHPQGSLSGKARCKFVPRVGVSAEKELSCWFARATHLGELGEARATRSRGRRRRGRSHDIYSQHWDLTQRLSLLLECSYMTLNPESSVDVTQRVTQGRDGEFCLSYGVGSDAVN